MRLYGVHSGYFVFAYRDACFGPKKGKTQEAQGRRTCKKCVQNGNFEDCCPENTVFDKCACSHSQKFHAFCKNP
jgi:hypothetical protein